jgi:hypothetical protein
MSDKALFHTRTNLAHKILIVYERHGAENVDYLIRSFQSEGKIRYMFAFKDPESKEGIGTLEREVEGPICFIQTTTATQIHTENETRVFDLFSDDSENQTISIMKRQRQAFLGPPRDHEAMIRRWQNAQRLLEPYPVVIPYADHIEFPAHRLRARRDHLRFLGLIEALAVLAQRRRRREVFGGKECIVADCEDYHMAFHLANRLLKQTVAGYSPKCEELVRREGVLESVEK